jgi:hypothetical protein
VEGMRQELILPLQLARRQAQIALDGLAAPGTRRLPGRGLTRVQLETGFASGRDV